MRAIPQKLRREMALDHYYLTCARADTGECSGRITWEHAFIFAGKQINEKWAIIPLCHYHHLGAGLEKEINQLISLRRASAEDLAKYPRVDWGQKLKYLEKQYA